MKRAFPSRILMCPDRRTTGGYKKLALAPRLVDELDEARHVRVELLEAGLSNAVACFTPPR